MKIRIHGKYPCTIRHKGKNNKNDTSVNEGSVGPTQLNVKYEGQSLVAYGLSIADREPYENVLPFRQALDSLHHMILKTKSFLFHAGKSVS